MYKLCTECNVIILHISKSIILHINSSFNATIIINFTKSLYEFSINRSTPINSKNYVIYHSTKLSFQTFFARFFSRRTVHELYSKKTPIKSAIVLNSFQRSHTSPLTLHCQKCTPTFSKTHPSGLKNTPKSLDEAILHSRSEFSNHHQLQSPYSQSHFITFHYSSNSSQIHH